ncbi:MAG: ATP-binding protein [Muribaculaceae bacterium]|nr:ATP-binding protein [Muribaculaceae bacterium]
MANPKYPIGIQTFEKIIEEGFIYVDKTRFIAELIRQNGYYFLSRPRRFGKSLLLSTLHAYFDGKRELFKGLYLDSADVDWEPTPVLHFDLNSENYQVENGLEIILNHQLKRYEEIYGVTSPAQSIATRFTTLIEAASVKTGKKVAVLVDEYDKPLLNVEDSPHILDKNQAILKSFFGNLKSMDRFIKFGFITGVARFNKVSIFSDINNLKDISLNNKYADICGVTQEELLKYFRIGISKLKDNLNVSFERGIELLRQNYDGYLFSDKGSRLFNPYSLIYALDDSEILPYWYETATPTFLAKRIKKSGVILPSLDRTVCTRAQLLATGIDNEVPLGLMFQTGYLTIDSYDPDLESYTLRFPNREVRIGFAEQLYHLYVPDTNTTEYPFGLINFKRALAEGNPEDFMARLQALCKSAAFESHNEDNYRNIVWLLCTLCGSDSQAERHSYRGRSDLEVKTRNYIYVFEFKYNGSVEEAMRQIHARDYAGQYTFNHRKVFLIGANFSTKSDTKGLSDWRIEKIKP